MRFKRAVETTPEIKAAWRDGLKALRRADGKHVSANDTRRLAGSVDVDTTLKDKYPNDARWDYAIGYQLANTQAELIYWIEIHPANEGEIKVVIAKLGWLKNWLKEKAPSLNAMQREFIWLSSGKTTFTLTSPQQKKFALLGLQHRGRHFQIPGKADR